MLCRKWPSFNKGVLEGTTSYMEKIKNSAAIIVYGSDPDLLKQSCEDFVFACIQSISNLNINRCDVDEIAGNLHNLRPPLPDLFSYNKKEFFLKIIEVPKEKYRKVTGKKFFEEIKNYDNQIVFMTIVANSAIFKTIQERKDIILVPFYEIMPVIIIDQLEFFFKTKGKKVTRQDLLKLFNYVGEDYSSLKNNSQQVIDYFSNKNELTFDDLKKVVHHCGKDAQNNLLKGCLNNDVELVIKSYYHMLKSNECQVNDLLPTIRILSSKFMQLFNLYNLSKTYGEQIAITKLQPQIFFKDKPIMLLALKNFDKKKI